MDKVQIAKVQSAVTHNIIHTAKTGQIGPSLSSTKSGLMKDMTLTLVSVAGTVFLNVSMKQTEILIPVVNVSHLVLE